MNDHFLEVILKFVISETNGFADVMKRLTKHCNLHGDNGKERKLLANYRACPLALRGRRNYSTTALRAWDSLILRDKIKHGNDSYRIGG